MHRLLDKQVKDALRRDGEIDLAKLLAAIDVTYTRTDEERRGVVRSMRLLADETSALTREVRESTASQLQAMLDHVKDAIVTVDEAGRIDSLNTTGERVFGHAETEIAGSSDTAAAALAASRANESLEELAARLDDTQADLAAARNEGPALTARTFPPKSGSARAAGPPQVFIVCLRETTDRKAAEAAFRESEARYRTLVENAPEIIVVVDLDHKVRRSATRTPCAFSRWTRDELLTIGPDMSVHRCRPTARLRLARIARSSSARWPAKRRTSNGCIRDALGHDIPCEVRLVRLPVRRASADPRQHHGHHRAQAQRSAGGRRAARIRAHHGQRRTRCDAGSDQRNGRKSHGGHGLRSSRWTRRGHESATLSPGSRLPDRVPRCDGLARSPVRATVPARPQSSCNARSSWPRSHAMRSGNTRDVMRGRRLASLLVHADSRLRRPHPRHRGAVFQDAAQSTASRLRADVAHDRAGRDRDRTAHVRKKHCARARPNTAACSRTSSKAFTARRATGVSGRQSCALRKSSASTRSTNCCCRRLETIYPTLERARDHRGARARRRGPQCRKPIAARRRHARHGRGERACRHATSRAPLPVTKARLTDVTVRKRAESAAVRRKGKSAGHAAIDRRRRASRPMPTGASSI